MQGRDWLVRMVMGAREPLSCVQGNTDPASASRFWLCERWITAEVMRQFRPKASAWSLFMLVYGPRTCPALLLWAALDPPLCKQLSGQPRGCLTQGRGMRVLPAARGAAHIPSKHRLGILSKMSVGAGGSSRTVRGLSTR